MAETFITQCPHCGTSFRVKDDQLAVANGSVRCGACLQVFSARNHIVSGKSTASGAGVKKQPATARQREPQKPAAQTPARQRQTTSRPATHPLAEQANSQPSNSEFEIDQDDDADFIFADDPNEDDEYIFQDSDDDNDDRQDGELGEFSDSFLNLSAPEPDKRQPDPFQRETQSLNREMFEDADSPDESWAESILDELEREERQKPEAKPEAPKRKPRAARSESRTQSSFSAEDPAPAPTAKAASDGNRASQLVRQLNHEIDLDFNVEERLARWRWLGGIFALLLLVLLAGQLAWLQKDTYAKMDQWRGLYATACDVLGCSLPAQEDLDKIRASNVLVRDHKAVEGVKMLDAVLINRAPFKQAFPILILQYTDVNGELVADQAFTPEQYLRGELTGAKQMPTNTRVYVSIPIRDPGERAVNYQLQLAPS